VCNSQILTSHGIVYYIKILSLAIYSSYKYSNISGGYSHRGARVSSCNYKAHLWNFGEKELPKTLHFGPRGAQVKVYPTATSDQFVSSCNRHHSTNYILCRNMQLQNMSSRVWAKVHTRTSIWILKIIKAGLTNKNRNLFFQMLNSNQLGEVSYLWLIDIHNI